MDERLTDLTLTDKLQYKQKLQIKTTDKQEVYKCWMVTYIADKPQEVTG